MCSILQFLAIFLYIYMLGMFVWALIGWLPMVSPGLAYNSTVVSIRNFLDSIILPYVKLFSFVKPVQIGNMMLDLSFIVAFLVLILTRRFVLSEIAAAAGCGLPV